MSNKPMPLHEKFYRYREQFQVTISEIFESTGISEDRLKRFENNEIKPTGDEILILSDYYKCDFRFFISNKKVAPFDETEYLFRNFGGELSKKDRWAIQEVLFLAECESFLIEKMGINDSKPFLFLKVGTHYKSHGSKAASDLRMHLGYKGNEIPVDIYKDFRSIGLKVFRRKLQNSDISGLYINHPVAGKCIIINYNEDMYRQRFTAAHEAAHSILDDNKDVVVSFKKWSKDNLVEIRANTFASNYLLPPYFIKSIPVKYWDTKKVLEWADKLNVNTEAFAIALKNEKIISEKVEAEIKSIKLSQKIKLDPELRKFSKNGLKRQKTLIQQGLSSYYVNLCLKGYREGIISASRLAEMLLMNETELRDLMSLYREGLKYGD